MAKLCKYRIIEFGAFLILLGITSHLAPLHAQGPSPEQRERIRARAMQFKKMKLIEVLNMDDQTAEKFFVRYNTEQKKIEEARKSLEQTMHELDKAVNEQQTQKIKDLTELTLKKHADMQQSTGEMLRAMRQYLNEQQYARFLLFEARFQEEIRQLLMDMKQGRKDRLMDQEEHKDRHEKE